jgi:hypothetical protein
MPLQATKGLGIAIMSLFYFLLGIDRILPYTRYVEQRLGP